VTFLILQYVVSFISVHFLSTAFIDVANLFADPACTCHCRMYYVCIDVNKLVQTTEENTREKEAVKRLKKKYIHIYDKFS